MSALERLGSRTFFRSPLQYRCVPAYILHLIGLFSPNEAHAIIIRVVWGE